MNSLDKGNSLEDAFYLYLLGQKERGELVYGAAPPENCEIFRKKEYYCRDREANVEFDIVLEVRAAGRSKPYLYVIFECKNYKGNIPALYVNDFSSKLGSIFPHSAKGVIVISSRLQSGAERTARNKGLGIVKYDPHGLDIIADRKARPYIEHGSAQRHIFENETRPKPLKFAAYFDGHFFASLAQFLGSLHPELSDRDIASSKTIPFLPAAAIQDEVGVILKSISYDGGPVDLGKICRAMAIELQIQDRQVTDSEGTQILGSAHFHRKQIYVNADGYLYRERFTLAHEIGHFALQHQVYLSSENIIERDLMITREADALVNIERLEFQANAFSSSLILPDHVFARMTAQYREELGMRNRGHGYIFVDDQPSNLSDYDQLLSKLSTYFEASKRTVELKFKRLGMLTDMRKRNQKQPAPQLLETLISNWGSRP